MEMDQVLELVLEPDLELDLGLVLELVLDLGLVLELVLEPQVGSASCYSNCCLDLLSQGSASGWPQHMCACARARRGLVSLG